MGWFFGDEESMRAEIHAECDKLQREFEAKGDVGTAAQIDLATQALLAGMQIQLARASHQLKAHHAELDARIAKLEKLVAELETRGASIERRVSRHAQHLQNLEDRRVREGS